MLGVKYANICWFSKETFTHRRYPLKSEQVCIFGWMADMSCKTHILKMLIKQIPGAWDQCIRKTSSCELNVQGNGLMRKLPLWSRNQSCKGSLKWRNVLWEMIQEKGRILISVRLETVFQDCCIWLDDLNALLQKLASVVWEHGKF